MLTHLFTLLALASTPSTEIQFYHGTEMDDFTQCSTFYQSQDQLNGYCQMFTVSGYFNWTQSNTPISIDIVVDGDYGVQRTDCWLVDTSYVVECGETIFTDGFDV